MTAVRKPKDGDPLEEPSSDPTWRMMRHLEWDAVEGSYKWLGGPLRVSRGLLDMRYPGSVYEDEAGTVWVEADAVNAALDRIKLGLKRQEARKWALKSDDPSSIYYKGQGGTK